ncbi:hypothetical protein NA57DRAFT_70607 [Rhizodiscina lignyota]|uniref:Uncharacterized protein n=1 Tax=Rhizodiscina lignyota TaxID=1504668 RepID=A0A9P4IS55_9PEZI|nr:hypothetical protein NA57DRAFT_70607 [Rhizodiscina lignyota]
MAENTRSKRRIAGASTVQTEPNVDDNNNHGKKHIHLAAYRYELTPENDEVRKRNSDVSFRWEIVVERENLATLRNRRRYFIDTDWKEIIFKPGGRPSPTGAEWKYEKLTDAPEGKDMIGIANVGKIPEEWEDEESNGLEGEVDIIDILAQRIQITDTETTYSWVMDLLYEMHRVKMIWKNSVILPELEHFPHWDLFVVEVRDWDENWVENQGGRKAKKAITRVKCLELM